ncbi:MAG: hypothetical protein ACP5MZ_00880 [Candidatus Micrarchaeia archaeon]
MVHKRVEDQGTPGSIRVVDVSTFLNISNNLKWSYSRCMQDLEKLNNIYDTSHERIFRKLKLITNTYISEFNRIVDLSKSKEVSNKVEKCLNKIIREFSGNKVLNDALASAQALSLLDRPPENMGYSQIERIFDVINASYKDLLDRITILYKESMEQQVRIYKRK